MEQQQSLSSMELSHMEKSVDDDDGRAKRTGTLWTASAHIVTAVIGSGVLSLGWAMAQMGWIAGPIALLLFSAVTWFSSTLLADAYRSPDPITGKRNHTYMEAVRAILGGRKVQLCGVAQYANLVGVTIGFTITGSISMGAIQRSDCFHRNGHEANCSASNYISMAVFAGFQIVLSQIPNFHKLWWLSTVAAAMSFTYSFIGVGLSIARIAECGDVRMGLTGVVVGRDVTGGEKVWRIFQSLGDIAAAYTFSIVLIEIQDTLRSNPPEIRVMKKASSIGVSITTIFYLLCGCLGYAAFGNDAPGNFLTGFGFYEPFWLIDLGNVCVAIHLVGAYQVFAQPIYQLVELRCSERWPEKRFLTKVFEFHVPFWGRCPVNAFRVVWRSLYVIVSAIVAMIFPFFNSFLGLLGALAFWPLTVYFPVEMHIKQAKVRRGSQPWVWLQALSSGCLLVSLLAVVGSVQGLVQQVEAYKPFQKF